jgi:hypothetical protein
MSAADKARRLLRRPGAWLEAAGYGYALRVGPTRRMRVMLTLDEAAFRALAVEPGLRVRPGGGWSVREAPVPHREEAGRPGVVEGHKTVVEADGRVVTRRANLGLSAVAWLARHRDADGQPWLGAAEVAAAQRLEADAEIALKGPSLTMRWDALPRSGGGSAARVEPGDRAIAASRRVEAALRACGSDRAIVEAVCIRASTLQVAERGLGLSRRTGKTALVRGLRALAAHYRIG